MLNTHPDYLIHTSTLRTKPLSVMWRGIIYIRAERDNSECIDNRVASVVMFLDVIHVNGVTHAWDLIYVFREIEQIRVLTNHLLVALEVNDIDLSKKNKCIRHA